jgi:hypothetical protein
MSEGLGYLRPSLTTVDAVNISETELERREQQSRHDRLAYTIDELRHASRICRSKIYTEIKAGRLKVRKAGKRTLVLHGDAMDWLQSLPTA